MFIQYLKGKQTLLKNIYIEFLQLDYFSSVNKLTHCRKELFMEIVAVHLKFHNEQESLRNFEDLLERINPTIQQKIYKFHRYEDKLRSLCGEMLLQVFSNKHWHLSQKVMLRKVNSYGKPGFVKYPNYQFNISHSGNWVVAAFDSLPIGIDIEKIAAINLEVAERFFTKSEINMIHMKTKKDEQIKLFYELWTLKESYVKAVGKGLSIPLDSFAIDITGDRIINLQQPNKIPSVWNFKQYDLNSEYALAVCGQNPTFPKQIKYLEWEELRQCFNNIYNANC